MNNNKIMQQFHAMFSVFMVVFYLGCGIFFLFFNNIVERYFNANPAIWGILGATFLLYGLYRTYVAYKLIVAAFFTRSRDEEG